jgi:hypothetical protein
MKCAYHYCKKEVETKYCSRACLNKHAVDKRRQKIKFMAIKYKGGCCSRCGYNKCTAALEFHHRNKNEKSFDINLARTRSWDKIQAELDKCDMVCANCHREIEWEELAKTKPRFEFDDEVFFRIYKQCTTT